jgi:LAO/AO transport system kinase
LADTSNIAAWVARILSGDVRATARAISAIEDNTPESIELLTALFPHTGKARVFGITGSPGAGKSTLVDHLAREYRKEQKTLGIVAVDPSSPYSGGAILGDRIRMQAHHADPGIYIRSMATRGFLGGLARTTADATTVLAASGKDIILVETVGVGQDEIDIVRLADVTVVILVPGMGDDVQSIKAGIMEIADIFVINKSDRDGADRVEKEIRAMQSLAVRTDNWTPSIVRTVASEGKGTAELAKAIEEFEAYQDKHGLRSKKKQESWRERLIEMLRESLLARVLREQLSPEQLTAYAAEIAEHRRDPYTLVDEIVRKFGK